MTSAKAGRPSVVRLTPPETNDQLKVFKQAFIQLLGEHEALLKRLYPRTYRKQMFNLRLRFLHPEKGKKK